MQQFICIIPGIENSIRRWFLTKIAIARLPRFLFLRTNNICVPAQCILKSDDKNGAAELLHQWGFPLCIKPDDLAESIDVFPNILSENDYWGCWNYMRQMNAEIIIEKASVGQCFAYTMFMVHSIL